MKRKKHISFCGLVISIFLFLLAVLIPLTTTSNNSSINLQSIWHDQGLVDEEGKIYKEFHKTSNLWGFKNALWVWNENRKKPNLEKETRNTINFPNKNVSYAKLKNNIDEIPENAFSDYPNLKSVIIPEKISKIKQNAFSNCPKLKTVVIHGQNVEFDATCFQDIHEEAVFFVRSKQTKQNLLNCKNIGNSHKIIFISGDYFIFDGLKIIGLTSEGQNSANLFIPNGIKVIGNNCFLNCEMLQKIIFPNSLQQIGKRAFSGCTKLTSVHIPENVDYIGEDAFRNCINLAKITIRSKTITIGNKAFANIHENAIFYINHTFCETALVTCGSGISTIKIILSENDWFIFDQYQLVKTTENCRLQNTIVVPKNIKLLKKRLFANHFKLQKIILNKEIEHIEAEVFDGCKELQFIEIRSETIDFDQHAFKNIPNNIKIVVLNNSIKNKLITLGIDQKKISLSDAPKMICNFINPDDGQNIKIIYLNATKKIADFAFHKNKSLRSVEITEGVTKIGISAFEKCENLSLVRFPKSLIEIEESAFEKCPNLTKVFLPEKIKIIQWRTFYKCTNLKIVAIPPSVNKIDEDAFAFCHSLALLGFNNPKNSLLTTIENGAFKNCFNLQYFTLPPQLNYVGKEAFLNVTSKFSVVSESVALQLVNGSKISPELIWNKEHEIQFLMDPQNEKITGLNQFGLLETALAFTHSIKENAIHGAKNLRIAIISNSVEEIGENAFSDCPNLEKVLFQENSKIKEIKDGTFKNCPKLSYIKWPESIEKIGAHAFSECKSLECIFLPDSLTLLDQNAFAHCDNLTAVYCGNEITKIGDNCFNQCIKMERITLSGNLQIIGEAAFKGCINLREMEIPESVDKICKDAFSGCSTTNFYIYKEQIYQQLFDQGINVKKVCWSRKLTRNTETETLTLIKNDKAYADNELVLIPKIIDTIAAKVFQNYTKMRHVILPDTLAKIEEYAFEGCSNLEEITIPVNIRLIEKFAFANCTKLKKITINAPSLTIEKNAFLNLDSLKTVILNTQTIEIKDDLFDFAAKNKFTVFYVISDEVRQKLIASGADPHQIIQTKEIFFECEERKITGVTHLGKTYKKLEIPSGVDEIGQGAFADNDVLTTVVIERSVMRIGDYAFKNCKNLATAVILSNATHIGKKIFDGCKNLKDLINFSRVLFDWIMEQYILENTKNNLPLDELDFNKLKNDEGKPFVEIHPDVFADGAPFKRMIFPDHIDALDLTVFNNCKQLKEVYYYGQKMFYPKNPMDPEIKNVIFYTKWWDVLWDFASIIGDEQIILDHWGHFKFSGTKIVGLTETGKSEQRLIIPEGITEIAPHAFRDSHNLVTIEFPKTLKKIGRMAFYGCEKITDCSFYKRLSEIESEAFANCKSLKHVFIVNESEDQKIGYMSFSGIHEDADIWVVSRNAQKQLMASLSGLREEQFTLKEGWISPE